MVNSGKKSQAIRIQKVFPEHESLHERLFQYSNRIIPFQHPVIKPVLRPFAIAVANVLYGFVGVLLNTWPNKKLVNYKLAEQFSDISPQLLLSLAVAAVAYLVGLFEMNCYLLLGMQLVVGFGLYWLASKKLSLESYTYIVSTVKSFRNKNS